MLTIGAPPAACRREAEAARERRATSGEGVHLAGDSAVAQFPRAAQGGEANRERQRAKDGVAKRMRQECNDSLG